MRLVVNHKKCLRSGQCAYLQPELFKTGPDGAPIVLADPVGDDIHEAAEDAADLCPSGAIILEAE